ncbi:hypothetical protein QTP88_002166 [Uroleucon formosanum]
MIVNVLKNIEHENHPPSPAQVEVTKVILNMNTKAQDNFDTPSRLFAVETSNLLNEATILLTEEKSVKRSLRRIRNKKYPPLCPLSELKINGIWTTMGGPEPKPFLLFDNENNTNRIIVFASPEGISYYLADHTTLRGQEQIAPVDQGSHILQTFVQPSSLQVQKVVQQELEANDKRWEQRFHHVNNSQKALNRNVEIEYKKTYENVKKLLPIIKDGVLSETTIEKENVLLDCLANNKGTPLNCTDAVKDYQKVLFQSTNQKV